MIQKNIFKMYAENTFMLVFITLCLVSGYFSFPVNHPSDENDLISVLSAADLDEYLSVIYFVQDQTYDNIFNELAGKFDNTLFVRVDTNTVKIKGESVDFGVLPVIVFHKFGLDEPAFNFNNKNDLATSIETHQSWNKEEFFNVAIQNPNVANGTNQQEHSPNGGEDYNQIHLSNGVLHCSDYDDLLQKLKAIHEQGLSSVMFITDDNSNALESLLAKLALAFKKAYMIQTNQDTFDNARDSFNIDTQPAYIYGDNTENAPSNQEDSNSNIHDYRGLQVEDFELAIELALQRSKEDLVTNDTQSPIPEVLPPQADVINKFKYPRNTNELVRILKEADQNENLAVMYLVINTNNYDAMFNTLATMFSSVVIIKIDVSKYNSEFGLTFDVTEQPSIMFYKFGLPNLMFHSTDESDLFDKITDFQGKTKNEYTRIVETEKRKAAAADAAEARRQQRTGAGVYNSFPTEHEEYPGHTYY